MSKATTLLILALLLCSTLSDAARPLPEVTSTPTKTQHKDVEARRQHADVVGEKCEEGIEEEECLMRRTLVAHLDYIYTQSKNP